MFDGAKVNHDTHYNLAFKSDIDLNHVTEFTGTDTPQLRLSSSNKIMVRFHTEGLINSGYRGFKAVYFARGIQILFHIIVHVCQYGGD